MNKNLTELQEAHNKHLSDVYENTLLNDEENSGFEGRIQ